MTDKYIINYFSKYSRFLNCLCTNEISQYLLNRFKDSDSLLESYLRIKNNIETRPICPVCGNKLKFIGGKKMYTKHCSTRCSSLDKNVQNKSKETCLKKYGVEYSWQSENNKEKSKKTKLERYGDENYKNMNKVRQTKLERYGNENYNNLKKAQKTCLEKYGYENPFQNKEFIKRNTSPEKYIQRHQTRKKHGATNTSIPEQQSYKLIKERYSDVLYQYRSELYPFNCDFYIPSLDLYIECNYFWTHGNHFYNPNNIEDLNKLQFWKNKNTSFYNKAIKVWTIYDQNKLNIAKQNNLNYLVFWNIKELKEWLNNQ